MQKPKKMKTLISLLTILLSLVACNQTDKKTVDNDFLTTELKNLKEKCLKKFHNDAVRYKPTEDFIKYLDKDFDALISNIDNSSNNDIHSQLVKCKESIIKLDRLPKTIRVNIDSAMASLIYNVASLDRQEIKQRLQFIQYIYWKTLEEKEYKYLYTVDTIGIFLPDNLGKNGKTFSTLLVPIAHHTTFDYLVLTGDSFAKNGQLLGNIDTLKLNRQHIPIFQTSNYKKGDNLVPAQMLTKNINAETDTINFYIEYKIE